MVAEGGLGAQGSPHYRREGDGQASADPAGPPPPYTPPRLAWRLLIHRVVAKALGQSRITYTPEDRFEVSLRL